MRHVTQTVNVYVPAESHKFGYMIVIDYPPEHLERLSKENERCIIFNFIINCQDDFSGLASSPQANWIVYIGGIPQERRDEVMDHIVADGMGQFWKDAIRVYPK